MSSAVAAERRSDGATGQRSATSSAPQATISIAAATGGQSGAHLATARVTPNKAAVAKTRNTASSASREALRVSAISGIPDRFARYTASGARMSREATLAAGSRDH